MRAWLALLPLMIALPACFETYCQAGQKGTQCMSAADLAAEKRSQGREEPASETTRTLPPWTVPATGQQASSPKQRAQSDAGLGWRPGLTPRATDAALD